jgi:hypothetical protein
MAVATCGLLVSFLFRRLCGTLAAWGCSLRWLRGLIRQGLLNGCGRFRLFKGLFKLLDSFFKLLGLVLLKLKILYFLFEFGLTELQLEL